MKAKHQKRKKQISIDIEIVYVSSFDAQHGDTS